MLVEEPLRLLDCLGIMSLIDLDDDEQSRLVASGTNVVDESGNRWLMLTEASTVVYWLSCLDMLKWEEANVFD